MPNLILSIDESQFYDPDITRFHDFIDCEIQIKDDCKLLKAEAKINNENSILYLLTDQEGKDLSIIRLVNISIFNEDYFQIKKSYSPIPNKGYGYLLYCLVIENHKGSIVSDSFNTLPGSYNVWMKLLRDKKYAIQLFNIVTGRKSNIDNPINELKIWGVETEYLEEIDKTEWGSVIFENEFTPKNEDDLYEEEYYINYISENDKYDRSLVSDFVVKALKKGKKKIKDRKNTLLMINYSS